jgi:hypothetical protein
MLLLITLSLVSKSRQPPSLLVGQQELLSHSTPHPVDSLCRALVRHVRPLRILPHPRNRLLVRPRTFFRDRVARLDHLVVRVPASLFY